MPVKALSQIGEDEAVRYINRYFDLQVNGRPLYTGSRFETFAGGGRANANRITASDLIAVSMLGVHVPAQASIGILGSLSERIERLLYRVPVDVTFENLTKGEFDQLLGRDSPCDELWKLLRQKGDRWKVGQTTASKIIARKRPNLVPIYDSVIARETGMEDSKPQWDRWFAAFHGDDGAKLTKRLGDLREKTGQHHLSLLRVLDIVLWMNGARGESLTETVGDEG